MFELHEVFRIYPPHMNKTSRWLPTSCQLGGQNTSSSHWGVAREDGTGRPGRLNLDIWPSCPGTTAHRRPPGVGHTTMHGACLVSHLFWTVAHCTTNQDLWDSLQLATRYKPATDLARATTLGRKQRTEEWWIISTETQTKFNLKQIILLQVNLKRKVQFLFSFCTDNIRSRVCFELYQW